MTDFKNKKVGISGGGGFLSTELTKQFLERGANVRAFSRNETKLFQLKEKFPSVEVMPVDIFHRCSVAQAMEGVDILIHAAAVKIVQMSETFTTQTVRTNVIGTLNILEESLFTKPEALVYISTDKCSSIRGFYASSKSLGEGMMQEFQTINKDTRYITPRYGNIIFSSNSVIPKWLGLLNEGRDIELHNPESSRFLWSVSQAADFIFDRLENATSAAPQIPTHMKGMRMDKLLEAFLLKYAKGKKVNVNITSLGNADNLHERLVENGPTSAEVEQWTIEEILPLI